jgi:hypothetical protein
MSYVQSGVLVVESGDVISGTVVDGQYVSNLLSGLPMGSGLWGAVVDSGGTLVGADIFDFGSRGERRRARHRYRGVLGRAGGYRRGEQYARL